MTQRALIPESMIGVVGAGAMGAGIAQIAAQAGHPVKILDTRPGAAQAAIAGIVATLTRLVEKNKISARQGDHAISALSVANSLADLRGCDLVIEAIVENLDAKRALFLELEAVLGDDAVLASNTSSISITAIGAALRHPGRLVGMHFFNPAPLMPLVEVVSGLASERAIADQVFALAQAWGKSAVHARSTPGFIVNRVARPFYAEGLRLLQEGVADAVTLDAVMRECGGFKMGPFELMDLIGHDVNYAVTRSVFDAFYGDPRFAPSLIQLELVQANRLGRKNGRGFYAYGEGAVAPAASQEPLRPAPRQIEIRGDGALAAALAARLDKAGIAHQRRDAQDDGVLALVDGACLAPSDGRTATQRAARQGCSDLVLIDHLLRPHSAPRAAIAAAQCGEAARNAVVGLLQAAGFAVSLLGDSPALAVLRTVSMLANEACDAVHQGVCDVTAADLAMKGGVGYPLGPIEWADAIGAPHIVQTLDHLERHYGEPRYRTSPLLRRAVWAGARLRD